WRRSISERILGLDSDLSAKAWLPINSEHTVRSQPSHRPMRDQRGMRRLYLSASYEFGGEPNFFNNGYLRRGSCGAAIRLNGHCPPVLSLRAVAEWAGRPTRKARTRSNHRAAAEGLRRIRGRHTRFGKHSPACARHTDVRMSDR